MRNISLLLPLPVGMQCNAAPNRTPLASLLVRYLTGFGDEDSKSGILVRGMWDIRNLIQFEFSRFRVQKRRGTKSTGIIPDDSRGVDAEVGPNLFALLILLEPPTDSIHVALQHLVEDLGFGIRILRSRV